MRAINAAVIPESLTEQDTTSGTTKRMVFYCTVVTTSDGECDGCKNFAPRTLTSTLTKSFVFSMLPTSCLRMALDCGFLMEVQVGLIAKSLSNG